MIGMITTCVGATRGGSTRPSSSACAMISVPMSRVLTPQLVVQAYSFLPSRERYWMPDALAKFCPRKCDVPGLHRLAVLHHRLDAKRVDRAGETLACALASGQNGNGQVIAREGLVDIEHPARLVHRLRFRLVRGVALLPEKFGCAQEDARAHFPPDDVGPLVEQQRQVAIRLHPLRVGSRR